MIAISVLSGFFGLVPLVLICTIILTVIRTTCISNKCKETFSSYLKYNGGWGVCSWLLSFAGAIVLWFFKINQLDTEWSTLWFVTFFMTGGQFLWPFTYLLGVLMFSCLSFYCCIIPT
jgi:hypothetical protein